LKTQKRGIKSDPGQVQQNWGLRKDLLLRKGLLEMAQFMKKRAQEKKREGEFTGACGPKPPKILSLS